LKNKGAGAFKQNATIYCRALTFDWSLAKADDSCAKRAWIQRKYNWHNDALNADAFPSFACWV